MGLNLCKCFSHYCCCWCCCFCKCCHGKPQNSVGIVPDKKLKLLLLGLSGSGKTEIAHYLTKTERLDYDATNGVHNYCFKLMETMCSLTEIGGSDDMQRIWHHYFVGTMGVIYCFNMSSNCNDLEKAFKLLQQVMMSTHIMAKPILLVATKADLANESIQLYDIENTFQIQQMAVSFGSRVKLCCYDPRTEMRKELLYANLSFGLQWLVTYILNNYHVIQMRLNCDKNMQNWKQQRNKLVAEGKLNLKKYERFPMPSRRSKFWNASRKNLRVRTAPSRISFISTVEKSQIELTEPVSPKTAISSFTKVPNGKVYFYANEKQADVQEEA